MVRDSNPPPEVDSSRETGSAVDPSFAEATGIDGVAKRLVDAASEAFVLVDDANRIRFANPAIEDVLGYDPEAVVGERLLTLIPERLHDAHIEGFRSHLRTGERTLEWDGVELPGRHSDGHEVPLLVSFREFDRGGERYFAGIVRGVAEQVDRREELAAERAFVDSMFDALPDVVYAFDRDGQFLRWNERACEVTGYDDAEIESLDPLALTPESDHDRLTAAISRVFDEGAVETLESRLVTKDGAEKPYEFTGAPIIDDGEVVGLTGVGRDIAERKRREETLERLDELNTVIRSVDRALVEESDRDEIARAVCNRLVEEGAYRGAVVGRTEDDCFEVDVAAGVARSAVGVLRSDGDGPALAARAVESREVRVRDWEKAVSGDGATERGYRTVAAVPLVADGRTFGVLGVYADRSGGISGRERTVLEELGRTIGNAVQAALACQLLYSNTVTEIELRSTNRDVTFVALSARADCRLDLERALPFGDEQLFYFTATDAPADRVLDCAADQASISSAEHLGSDGGEHLFEFRTQEGTITTVLTDSGARTVAGAVAGGEARLVAELPPDGDVRAVVDAVQSAYPGTELTARRESDRSLRTPVEFRREIAADLTDKQRTALESAYFAGYFEWPTRTSNAEDVAETLGIASQTFHQHLRIAERKILSALFEGDGRHS